MIIIDDAAMMTFNFLDRGFILKPCSHRKELTSPVCYQNLPEKET
jgi:hypothetical protein